MNAHGDNDRLADLHGSLLERVIGHRRRLPIVLQTEATECGLACLAMLAGYHGFDTDLPTLRARYSISLKGASLAQLMSVAGRLGFDCRPLRLELSDLSALTTPCMLHWDLNHFVVLRSVNKGGIVVHDPGRGICRVSWHEASTHFTGVALEVTPSGSFTRRRERRVISLFGECGLIGPVAGLKRSFGQILIVALALQVLALVAPFYLQWVVDGAIVSADRELLTTLVLAFALLLGLQMALMFARAHMLLFLSTQLGLKWSANVVRHLLRLPMQYFEKRSVGDISSRLDSLQSINRTLTTSFVEALIDGALAVTTFVVMAVYSFQLTGLVFAAVAGYGLLRWVAYAPIRRIAEEQLTCAAKQETHLLETLRGMQPIRLFGKADARLIQYMNLAVDTANRSVLSQRYLIYYRIADGVIFGALGLAVVYFGALSVLGGVMSVGMLFAFTSYSETFVHRTGGLIDKFVEMRMLTLHLERLADIVLEPTEPLAPEGVSQKTKIERNAVGLSLHNVSFRYAPGEPWILRHCSFSLEPGESVAIVAPSGAGKSTLAKLILGLLEPEEGEVRVDGVSLARFGVGEFRQRVGTVMQHDQLFAGSIAENICFFEPGASHAQLTVAARTAAIHDDIEAMPMGYDTLVGDMGSALSGGQRQRILLARALYRRPGLLILDEATSHLDVLNEAKVSDAISSLAITRLIIAHRPETIASAERVIELQCVQSRD